MDTATTRAIHKKYVWLIRRKPSEVFLRHWYQSSLGRRSDGGPRARIVETNRIGLPRRNGEIRRDNRHIRSPNAWLKWLNKSILGRVGEKCRILGKGRPRPLEMDAFRLVYFLACPAVFTIVLIRSVDRGFHMRVIFCENHREASRDT